MKKLTILLFCMGICLPVSVFSGGTDEGQGSSDQSTVILKLGVATATDHPHSISAREFARLVDVKTQGRVIVEVFDSGSLGSNPELLDGVKTGIIDLAIVPPGIMAEYSALTGILEVPYIFVSKAHMMQVTRGPIGEKIAATYAEDTGMEILGYLGGAQRNMITQTRPIGSFADLQGMKMRTWEWDVMLNWWKELGAIGSVVAFPEVYTALQTGVVDGAENEFSSFTSSRWAEVAKYIALTQHSITVRPLLINEESLASLPADLQKSVRDAGKEVADFDVDLEGKLDEENMAKLASEYGVQFTSPDKTPFVTASVKIIEAFAKERGLESLAAEIREAAE